jgi:hypothetical protein
MMMIYLAIIGVAALATITAAAIARSDMTWKRCPMCRSYFRGNVMTKCLPPDSDGIIQPQICQPCIEAEQFFDKRKNDLAA